MSSRRGVGKPFVAGSNISPSPEGKNASEESSLKEDQLSQGVAGISMYSAQNGGVVFKYIRCLAPKEKHTPQCLKDDQLSHGLSLKKPVANIPLAPCECLQAGHASLLQIEFQKQIFMNQIKIVRDSIDAKEENFEKLQQQAREEMKQLIEESGRSKALGEKMSSRRGGGKPFVAGTNINPSPKGKNASEDSSLKDSAKNGGGVFKSIRCLAPKEKHTPQCLMDDQLSHGLSLKKPVANILAATCEGLHDWDDSLLQIKFQKQNFKNQIKIVRDSIDAKEENFEKLQQQAREEMKQLKEENGRSEEEVAKFIQLQDELMEEFVREREKLIQVYEDKKQKHWVEEVKLEKEYEDRLTWLMKMHAQLLHYRY